MKPDNLTTSQTVYCARPSGAMDCLQTDDDNQQLCKQIFYTECSDMLRGYHVVDAHDIRKTWLPFAVVQSKSHGVNSAGSSCNLEPMLV